MLALSGHLGHQTGSPTFYLVGLFDTALRLVFGVRAPLRRGKRIVLGLIIASHYGTSALGWNAGRWIVGDAASGVFGLTVAPVS
ncbi:MAG: hypothetical protein QOE61_1340 [Micromonosporaceae bacterium]|nr:hypothetical protein [Micromonosporaceae bacterium]